MAKTISEQFSIFSPPFTRATLQEIENWRVLVFYIVKQVMANFNSIKALMRAAKYMMPNVCIPMYLPRNARSIGKLINLQ